MLEQVAGVGAADLPEGGGGLDVDQIGRQRAERAETAGVGGVEGAGGGVEDGLDGVAVQAQLGQPAGSGEPVAQVRQRPGRAGGEASADDVQRQRRARAGVDDGGGVVGFGGQPGGTGQGGEQFV